jgi:hypothetical protein
MLVLAACSGGAPLERLDERTGITLTTGSEALVFARTEARYSRSARDYLYLGPVETNRQGVREYYLWVGIATTLDRGFLAPPAPPPRTLYVTVGGEPIELPLRAWTELVPIGGREPVYATAVPVHAELAARVTLQQLALFAAEPLSSVAVAGDGAGPLTYARWRGGGGLGDFVANMAGGSVQ